MDAVRFSRDRSRMDGSIGDESKVLGTVRPIEIGGVEKGIGIGKRSFLEIKFSNGKVIWVMEYRSG
tara:strand:+ start:8872 stop:9069 length:198 start_codon:yes stop_codon:yes gene_type:complete